MKHFKIFMTSMVLTTALVLSACGKDSSNQDINMEHQTSSQGAGDSIEGSTEESTAKKVKMEFMFFQERISTR